MANEHLSQTPPPPVGGEPQSVLESYERAVAGLRAGLVDLEASPSYLMLTADDLGAVTRSKIGRATVNADELWTRLEAVEGALRHISEYTDANGLDGPHRREVTRLLSERWIDAGSATGPQAISEVLAAVRRQYDEIRRWVTDIEQLWLTMLPRIDAARATLARLTAEVDRLGVPEPLVGRASALMADLEARLIADPLSVVADDGDHLDAQVAEAATQVASLMAGREALDDDLAGTEALLASLRLSRARAEASRRQALDKVLGAEVIRVPSVAVLDGPGGLAERLDRLFSTDAAAWNQRRALLDSWLTTARKLERQLLRARDANDEPLQRRDELRGRLRAYQAKISAVGRAEDLELTDVVDRARSELFTAPTDLERASATIDELARKLRS